jgi:uncharacterized protein (TIGR03032 family)
MGQRRSSRVPSESSVESLWAHHHAEYRDPHQVVCQWKEATDVDPLLLEHRVRGSWWDVIEELGVTLIVTREYEHLVMAFSCVEGKKRISYLNLPHPNGIAIDSERAIVHIASTRNPNIVFDLGSCAGVLPGGTRAGGEEAEGLLLPVRARYLPGSLYIHDLAVIGGELYANAAGMNAVARLPEAGGFEFTWWPRCIDSDMGPRFDKNYLQLNSIAPGPSVETSYFTASARVPTRRRPGHLNFPVDRRGVVFSGKTREVIGTGLTRPHSARLFGGDLWVDNSGYGEVGRVVDGGFEPIHRLEGWTRGLYFKGSIAFVGTSRVIPKYRHYAPGVDCEKSKCGIHAIDMRTGRILGSMLWPRGNQIFAIEGLDRRVSRGFPFSGQPRGLERRHVHFFSRGVAAGSIQPDRTDAAAVGPVTAPKASSSRTQKRGPRADRKPSEAA